MTIHAIKPAWPSHDNMDTTMVDTVRAWFGTATSTAHEEPVLVFERVGVLMPQALKRRVPYATTVDDDFTQQELGRTEAFLAAVPEFPDEDVVTPMRPPRRRLGNH